MSRLSRCLSPVDRYHTAADTDVVTFSFFREGESEIVK